LTASVSADVPGESCVGLAITMSMQGTQTTIALGGEWGLDERDASRRAIRRALARQPARVVLDLGCLSFIDSSGVQVIVDLVKRVARLRIELVIVPGTPAVQRIFDICELTERLPFTSEGSTWS
jgi:anti-anti-sigma factor